MLIINADDFGRSAPETDVAVKCYQDGRITSVSTMVFMADSERAAELVQESQLDVGLHLNFSETFTETNIPARLRECHNRLVGYLRRTKYTQLFYNPFLRDAFSYSYHAQAEEFARLFGNPPARVDGHHHMHLCANLLLSKLIPAGVKMRRSFSFWPGEKSWLNRKYRALVDCWLQRKYRLTDYFFDLTQCIEGNKFGRVTSLAKSNTVELMTHPIGPREADYLLSDEFEAMLQPLNIGDYAKV
jgi:predicted glycoside hydrolase/deacetylase ChbG (UPF0249 family)